MSRDNHVMYQQCHMDSAICKELSSVSFLYIGSELPWNGLYSLPGATYDTVFVQKELNKIRRQENKLLLIYIALYKT